MSSEAETFIEAWANENVVACPQSQWSAAIDGWVKDCTLAAARVGIPTVALEDGAAALADGYDLAEYFRRRLDRLLTSDDTWSNPKT